MSVCESWASMCRMRSMTSSYSVAATVAWALALRSIQSIVEALTASLEVSRRLNEAGNITDLDLARDRALAALSKLSLRSAEVASRQSREQLNSLMGAWGAETEWEIDGRLPDVPEESVAETGIERAALTRSIDLSNARQRIVAAGHQLGYDKATALIPSMDFGASAERDPDEGWRVGRVRRSQA